MKTLLICGILAALLAVILGAFAAHGLKSQLSQSMLNTFQTGVQYQMYHALAIILVALFYQQTGSNLLLWSASLLLVGILAFSGSLYALALTEIKWFGPITPFGGLCFIAGWAIFLIAVIKGSVK